MKKYGAQMLVPAFLLMTLVACNSATQQDTKSAEMIDPLIENMDSAVSPANDFFMYACGGWIKKNPIPGNEKSWGIWSMVQDETYNRMRQLSESAAKETSANGSNQQKIGDFYASGMDTVSIDKSGMTPLKDEFARIDGINDMRSLSSVLALFQTYGVGPLFSAHIYQDEKQSDRQALHFYQGGIGLPDRDYYFNTDARTTNIRAEYLKHLTAMFKLMGDDSVTAQKNAATVMKMETAMAKASRKLEALRDPYLNYNKMQVTGLKSLTPSIDWQVMLEGMHVYGVDTVIVGQPEFFRESEKMLKLYPLSDWKTYLRWNLINTFASYLSSPFEKQNFAFYGTTLSGVKQQRPRWKRILDKEEESLGDLLGQLYVEKYVSPAFKKRYQDLTNNIIAAYSDRIKQLDWMSDSTKQKALVKLNAITTKVAYPDKWKDYSSLEINRESYVMNVLRSHVWAHNYMVEKLNKPVDRTEWDMTPQTYNAYYNPSNNEIVLPAAIFIIPGMEDSLADDAIIYGYAGASTIGHELTHGFDDQGRQFDEKGNLRNWWSPKDEEEFNKRAKLIVKQFDEFKVLDSMKVNGEATQGENIADLGGVVLGYTAFKKTEQYKSGKIINGLTPDQRFFLGYALSWLGHMRDETLAMRIMTDVHAPNFLRVNGPVVNLPEFYKAFNIPDGAPMWRADSLRVHIW
ncbi:MAG: M13 family metallopeptidase [Bacteroidia bacterium]